MNSGSTGTFAILGGGIAGLTTAIALKDIGIVAKVYEAVPHFKIVGSGITLAVNAMKAFEHLGVYEEVLQQGRVFRQFSIVSKNGSIISQTKTDIIEKRLNNVAIHRAALHEVLLKQLDRSQICTNKKAIDIRVNAHDSEITFEEGSQTKANHIIVAEGINSMVRQKLFPGSVKRYSGYTCWRGIADNSRIGIDSPLETWGRNGRFGMVPLAQNKLYWFAVKNAPENNAEMKEYKRRDIHCNFLSYHDSIGQVIMTTPDENIIHHDIHDLKPINKFSKGNIVMIGDASHATTPNMGQGACMAIEDAIILANCIKREENMKNAFKQFEKKRMERTHYIVNQSWKMGKIAQWENAMAIAIRNSIFRFLPSRFYQKQLEKIYNFQLDW